MAYDAQCERWREVWAWLTAGWPEMRDECYVRGYWRGLDIAIRFNPVRLEPDVPAELDGTHAESWTRGYEDGDSHGQAFRIILLRRIRYWLTCFALTAE